MIPYQYPPGYSFFATYRRAIQLVNDPLGSIIESVNRFGDSYSVYSGLHKRMILTQDPEFIDYVLRKNHKNYNKSEMVSRNLARFLGKGLLTSNGPYWLRQRRLIQPGFHIQKIQGLYAIMKKTIDEFIEVFPEGEQIDIYPLMTRFAFEVVINTLFDIEVPAQAVSELSGFISDTQEFVIRDIRQPHKRWWHELSGEAATNLKKAAKARSIIREIIKERKSSHRKFNDLLDMLLDARYEESGEPMAEDQIIDEILVLIIAGHETTANALSWTLYLLASHPLELGKLRKSTLDLGIQETISHPGINAVINESMRLYPPAWASDRVALEDDSFNGYRYAKGTVIVMFYFGLHRSKRYWQDPEVFMPERFEVAVGEKDKSKNYYPFGGGPRLCIGNNFAMAEMALFLQAFVQAMEIHATTALPRMRPLITLRPDGIKLTVGRVKA